MHGGPCLLLHLLRCRLVHSCLNRTRLPNLTRDAHVGRLLRVVRLVHLYRGRTWAFCLICHLNLTFADLDRRLCRAESRVLGSYLLLV